MNVGSIYSVVSMVCTLQIILILNRSKATEYEEVIDIPFCKLLTFFAGFGLVDFAWGMFYSGLFGRSVLGLWMVSYGYHICAALSAYVGLGYGLSYIGAEPRERTVINFIRNVILVLQIIMLGWNLIFHNAFWVEADGSYTTGKLRLFMYILQLLYYILLMLYSIYKWSRNPKHKKHYGTILLFALIPLLFGIGQYLFFDVAMYSLGFTFAAFFLYSYNVTQQREAFMRERLSSLDKMQSSIIHGLAGNFVAIYYVDLDTDEFDIYRKSAEGESLIKEEKKWKNYFENALEHGRRIVVPEDRELFLQRFSRQMVLQELAQKNEYRFVVRILNQGTPHYYQYRFVKPIAGEDKKKLIVGVYDVDEEIRREQATQEQMRLAQEREKDLREKASKLSADVFLDAMTGLYNRRSYEEDMKQYAEQGIPRDFVYLSIDLNGLKIANDSMGHEAGDELLKGAASCMNSCLGAYGKLYRTGGDEFAAMLVAGKDQLYGILADFDRTVWEWRGQIVNELTVSYGFVQWADNPEMSVYEIAKMADKRMYQDKEDYYFNRGVDRRGQQEAYSALCSSYLKILKVNLTTDHFSIIQMDQKEKDREKGYRDDFSSWLREFAKTGQVHEQDRDNYLKQTEMGFLRDYFRQGNQSFCIYYRRRIGEEFKRAMLEIIPAKEYADEDQVVFLYVKNIEK